MKRVEMDFYGAKIIVEYEGPENPINFLTRRLAEVGAYAGRERTRGNAYAAVARHLAKNGFDKPSPGAKETEAAFKKRLERWAQVNELVLKAFDASPELRAFMKARSAQIAGLVELDAALTNTYPDLDHKMQLGDIYDGSSKLPTLPSPWYSAVVKKDEIGGGATKHITFDLENACSSKLTFGVEPD